MLDTLINFGYILGPIACGIVIIARFRGSPSAVLGAIAFGVWAATGIIYELHRNFWGLGRLRDIDHWLNLANLAGWGCLLAALITARVKKQA